MIRDEALLVASGVRMWFGGVHALTDVNFEVKEREIRCLIGPNGAGKSTFFKVLSGQLKPTAGIVRLDGVAISGRERFSIARAGIGIKNQVPCVLEGLSVRENLWLAARVVFSKKGSDTRVEELAAMFPIRGILDTAVARLAHGQRQWVEIASVVAARPKVVLLDEPAAGMTDEERRVMVDVIRTLSRDAAVVLVEHDMVFIKNIASIISVLHQGSIIAEGEFEVIANDRKVRTVYLGGGL